MQRSAHKFDMNIRSVRRKTENVWDRTFSSCFYEKLFITNFFHMSITRGGAPEGIALWLTFQKLFYGGV